MDTSQSWSEVFAEHEGQYLNAEALQSLVQYAQSFPARQALYTLISRKEMDWLAALLKQEGYSVTDELPPKWVMTVERLARHLRTLALAMLTQDGHVITCESRWGDMEHYLGLPQWLPQVYNQMGLTLTPEQKMLLQPYWIQLTAHLHPQAPPVTPPEEGSDPPVPGTPTLMEMFS